MILFVYFLVYFFVFILGISIGSFLNVVIWRVQNNISIAKGRSFCPSCKVQIKNYDLVPILSYIILGGRCRSCKAEISLRYPLVEGLMGALAVLVFMRFGYSAKSLVSFVIMSIFCCIAMIDYDTMEIPDTLNIAVFVMGIAAALVFKTPDIVSRVLGMFIISVPMLLLTLKIPDSFGGGDVKLMVGCGLILGWQNTLLAMFIALLIGGSYAVYLLFTRKATRNQHIPFGPYICIGGAIALLYGDRIIYEYLKFFGIL